MPDVARQHDGARQPLIEARGLHRWYGSGRSLLARRPPLRAVDGVDLVVYPGEIVGLIGESGCGKSTLGRLLVRLEAPTAGTIAFAGRDITHLRGRRLRALRRQIQVIFQNPFETFDPRYRLRQALYDPLRIHGLPDAERRIAEVMERAGLPVDQYLDRYPRELSGGQLQRAAIARAMLVEPRFVVADEPVSMLDVSVRAEVLNFLLDLRAQRQTAFLFITHDLALARHVCDRIAVMYLGRIVEEGPAELLTSAPRHPYTRALLASVPDPDAGTAASPALRGEPPSPTALGTGCRFAGRCPLASEACRRVEPVLEPAAPGHRVACHFPWEEQRTP